MTPTALPGPVRDGIRAALRAETGGDVSVEDVRPVGGGCINWCARVEAPPAEPVFVKWNDRPPPGFFEAEADGLRALRERGGFRVPRVVGLGEAAGDGLAWLVLEYVPPGRAGPGFGHALGRAAARLHRPLEGTPGWEGDNFIGSLPQANRAHGSWAAFWREERLLPQIRMARDRGLADDGALRELEAVLDRCHALLDGEPAEGISLLHGDLWSGNVYAGPDGGPVVVDPAVYRGHREVDLAMAELFGGFPADFLPSYREAFPLGAEYDRVRRDLYQLYPLLVHVNLFGEGYLTGTLARARRVAAA